MVASTECRDLIKKFEGCRLAAYKDIVGVWTIGYGHTGPDVSMGRVISKESADALLEKDIADVCKAIEPYVKVTTTQSEWDALVAFVFNVGIGHFRSSTLLVRLNEGNSKAAAEELLKWNKAGGRVVAGLAKRRIAERELFLKGTV